MLILIFLYNPCSCGTDHTSTEHLEAPGNTNSSSSTDMGSMDSSKPGDDLDNIYATLLFDEVKSHMFENDPVVEAEEEDLNQDRIKHNIAGKCFSKPC